MSQVHQNLIVSKDSEVFSPTLATIIVGIHLLSLGCLFSVTKFNIICWIIAHFYFGTIGASIGLHRMFSHRSFRPNFYFVKVIIAFTATLCFQGGPIFWAAAHRSHHLFSEGIGDPHSARRGFIWSHMAWLFYRNPNGFSYVRSRRIVNDLRQDRLFSWLERNAVAINLWFLAGLFVLCLMLNNPMLFFWIGPLRIVTDWHATWLVNSYAHSASFTPHRGGHRLRNSFLVSLVIGGDGDHRFHHSRPSSVRHAGSRWNFDYGYWFLNLARRFRLVKFRLPEKTRSSEKQLR